MITPDTKGQINRPWAAAVGFMGHAPGLKLLIPCTFTPLLFRVNVVAISLTLAAMLIAFLAAPPNQGLWWLFVAWVIGHFIWSTILASWILRGGGLIPPSGALRATPRGP